MNRAEHERAGEVRQVLCDFTELLRIAKAQAHGIM
jgi:hypothetical protein